MSISDQTRSRGSSDQAIGTEGTAIVDDADCCGLRGAFWEYQLVHEALKGGTKVFQVVGVKKWIPRGVEVRQDDGQVEQDDADLAIWAEGHHAIDGVEREPADDEEGDDSREILSGFHVSLLSRTEESQHRACRLVLFPTAGIHRHYLTQLWRTALC